MWYFLWSGSRKQWWRSGGLGYTPNLNEAGWFTENAARRHEEMSKPRKDERTVAVPVGDLCLKYVVDQGLSI